MADSVASVPELEGILDLAATGSQNLAQQFFGRHQHAGRADAALSGTVGEERLLQSGEGAVVCSQAFNRFDGAALDLAHCNQAGTDLPTVEQDGAGTAVAGFTPDFGAGKAQIIAQGGGEPCDRWTHPRRRGSVQHE